MARKANKMHPQTEKSVRNVKLTPRGQRWPKFISQSIEPAFSKYWIRHIEPDILIRIWFPQKNSFWISVSGWKLTIRPDNHPANRIVIVSAGKCAKLHSVATSKNRDHMLCALFFCLFATYTYRGSGVPESTPEGFCFSSVGPGSWPGVQNLWKTGPGAGVTFHLRRSQESAWSFLKWKHR